MCVFFKLYFHSYKTEENIITLVTYDVSLQKYIITTIVDRHHYHQYHRYSTIDTTVDLFAA